MISYCSTKRKNSITETTVIGINLSQVQRCWSQNYS